MGVFQLALLFLFCVLVFSAYTYPIRRDRIEQTCVKESKLKTFTDEFLTNLIIALPIVMVTYIISVIVEVFNA